MARRQWIDDVTPLNAANMNGIEEDLEEALGYELRIGSVKSGSVAGATIGPRTADGQSLDLTLPTDTEFGWLYAGFGNNAAAYEKLGVHYSPDGKYVVAGVNNPVYAPAGGVRDPQVYRHPTNGRYYCAYTINNGADKNLGLAVSDDLVNWSLVLRIPVGAATGMTRAWAPQIVTDTNGDVYMFFTNVNEPAVNHTIWRVKALNAELTAWSAPVAQTWAPSPAPQPGQYPIDPVPIFAKGKWWIFFGAETGQMWRASAVTLTGTWTVDKTGDWAAWVARADLGANTHYEAPEITEARPGVYRLYMDRYVGTAYANYVFAGYVWSETTDFETWTAPVGVKLSPGFPGGQTARHGTWLKLASAAEREKVIAATLGGLPPIRTATYDGNTGTKAAGTANLFAPPLVLDAGRSNRAEDFIEIATNAQLRIKVDGVYSIDYVLTTTPGTNLGGGWMALKSPDESINYMTNDYPNGPPAWGISTSNVYLRAGTVVRAFAAPAAAFATSGVLRMQLRVTKIQ